MSEEVTNLIVGYYNAHQELRAAQQAVEQLVKQAKEQMERLEKWRRLHVPGIPGMTEGVQDFDPSQWPSADALQRALTNYRMAIQRSKQAWERLPKDAQPVFQAPPA